ncbi:MAG: 2-oxoacid:acceptor oxidoreductase subunit alpha [Dehalococcoidia bacterium]|jgi:2-oxoglutarate ferredoxin oxidoreductase subunit alpha|nr:2-oxoacid:acceptor oxidoreductase subunit alpha [Dehalococcoidia bacterium]|tara:strand:+ start:349 stop:2064 length:1716 start_codon:yes stop_codon:yes gene_type:complete
MQMRDFVVRFAGEGGQGVVTSAEGLAQSSTQVGYHALTFATFPSQILGGPTWTQARISVDPVLAPGDDVNVLVAFNRDAYDEHEGDVREDGVVIFDSNEFELEGDSRSFGLPFEELAKSTGNNRAANMVIMGALAHLINMPQENLISFVEQRFTRGRNEDAQIIKSNIEALNLGRSHIAESGFSLGELAPPEMPEYKQVMIKGNEAVSLGAMAAGLDFYAGYPISPATPILLYMERNLVGENRLAYQVSSEIEAITAIIGAGYAGKRAMTATSGPGVSLMSEGLGLAWIAEIPLVVVNVQRGGPATGLPTKTEQSDLFSCMYPAHGDVKMPIIAAGTVEECFYGAAKAVEWAERYQGPVILMSEMALAERVQNIRKPDLSAVKDAKRVVYSGNNGYLRYAGSELSPMPIPGNPGAYVANGSEHDDMGDTTHLGERHVQMTERRFGKIKLLEENEYESDQTENSIAVLPWGGSKGPAQEAYAQLKESGLPVSWYYTMFLNPLPPKMLEELKKKDLVIVPELNYQGQFSSILRSMGVKAESITQYTGLPFKARTLVEKITEMTNASLKEMVRV